MEATQNCPSLMTRPRATQCATSRSGHPWRLGAARFLPALAAVLLATGLCDRAAGGEPPGGMAEISLLTGFSKANLELQDAYELVPVVLRLGWELPRGWRFNLEPYVGHVLSPSHRQEFGCSLFLRWSRPVCTPSLRVFVEAGSGPMALLVDTHEQSTDFNFISQAGAGCAYEFRPGWRVEAGYRRWHVSNAGLDHPNSGVDGNAFLVGLTRAF